MNRKDFDKKLNNDTFIRLDYKILNLLGIDAAILLFHLINENVKYGDKFFKSTNEIEKDTKLSRYKRKTATKLLQKLDLIEITRGKCAQFHYTINYDMILKIRNYTDEKLIDLKKKINRILNGENKRSNNKRMEKSIKNQKANDCTLENYSQANSGTTIKANDCTLENYSLARCGTTISPQKDTGWNINKKEIRRKKEINKIINQDFSVDMKSTSNPEFVEKPSKEKNIKNSSIKAISPTNTLNHCSRPAPPNKQHYKLIDKPTSNPDDKELFKQLLEREKELFSTEVIENDDIIEKEEDSDDLADFEKKLLKDLEENTTEIIENDDKELFKQLLEREKELFSTEVEKNNTSKICGSINHNPIEAEEFKESELQNMETIKPDRKQCEKFIQEFSKYRKLNYNPKKQIDVMMQQAYIDDINWLLSNNNIKKMFEFCNIENPFKRKSLNDQHYEWEFKNCQPYVITNQGVVERFKRWQNE